MPRSGMRDILADLRDGATDLTADETTTGVRVGTGGTPAFYGFSCVVVVPQDSAGDTLDITIEGCDDAAGTNNTTVLTFPQITGEGEYVQRFSTTQDYARAVLNVTGAGVNFGGVMVYLTLFDLPRE